MLDACALILFILLQLADGILTYRGISHTFLGMNYERNPIVVFCIQQIGVIGGLFVTKIFSIIAAVALYRYRKIKALGVKTAWCIYALVIIMTYILAMHFLTLNALTGG